MSNKIANEAVGDYGNALFSKYSRGLKNIVSAGAPMDYRVAGALARQKAFKKNIETTVNELLKDIQSFHEDPTSSTSTLLKNKVNKFADDVQKLLN